ncbi:DUF1206 domain-containing protein [Labedaea rhizosphaerae]|uniref:Uncharacterized protein DUF1206 n=1 Tax=Labedaea rhizosphaerae TaxID=598644 RepID=A0A4R6SMC0_LABRH|nr:DUF1206 domain-containing protein [Labedaea rhizosphaerae]TDQ05279.1 uncharacterized protein DUF1206 [Labedaea rhizosphaerae]
MSTANEVRRSRPVEVFGRIGQACYGVVHLLIAYLALQVAFGDSGKEADQHGAVATVAQGGFGKVLLWVLAIGLLAFGLWQLLLAATGFHWIEAGRKRVMKKIGAVVRGIVALAIGTYAIKFAAGSGGQSSDSSQKEMTAKLLSLPAGRVLVGIVALAVIGAGIAQIVTGVRKTFMEDLNVVELPRGTQQWVRRAGVAGYIAKGVAIGVVGILIGTAALDSNAGKAGGLDAALKTLGAQPFGVVILVVVALGFAAFGIYCFGAARAQRG